MCLRTSCVPFDSQSFVIARKCHPDIQMCLMYASVFSVFKSLFTYCFAKGVRLTLCLKWCIGAKVLLLECNRWIIV